jgi:hypothetical protein
MSIIQAPTMGQKNFNGAYGNKSASHLFVTLAAAPIGTIVELGHFSAGTRVDDMKIITDALGAASDIQIGVSYPSGDIADEPDKFLTIDTVAAKTTRYDGKPMQPTEAFILTATVINAPATGDIDIVIDYSFVG